jgi:hypothetical protein
LSLSGRFTKCRASPAAAVAPSKKRPASELADRGEEKTAGISVPKDDSSAPFVYQLVNSLRDYHNLIQGDPQASHSILQHQLSDKHPLCHLLIVGNSTESDKRNGADETSPVHQFVYWLFLATHCLHKLVEQGLASDGSAVTAAWLVHAVSEKLLVHLPAKQDRLTNAAARHVVGRALILVALAATEALSHLAAALNTSSSSTQHEEVTISVLSSSIQACVLALDAVTMVHSSAGSSGTSTATNAQVYWTRTAASWSRSMDTAWMEHTEILQNLMVTTEELDWSAERTAWHELGSHHVEPLLTSSSPVPPTGKRASRRTSGATASTSAASLVAVGEGSSTDTSSLLQAMEALIKLDSTSKIGLDSRLAIKRWTAVGLTWYGISGQEKLLTAANLLLQQESMANFAEP